MPRLSDWWSDRSLRSKSLAVAAIPVLAVVFAAAAFGLSRQAEDDAATLVAHTIEVQSAVDEVLEALVDAESGVRGYTITGRPEWLEPYERAVADLPAAVAGLEALVSDNPGQEARVQALQPAIDRRLDLAARLRAAAPLTASNQADVLSIMTQGQQVMDELRGQLQAITDEEERLLSVRRADLGRDRTFSTVVLWASIAGAILGGGLAALLLSSGITSRIRRVEENARRIARGQPLSDLPTGADEIGHFGATLIEAQALLDGRTAELRAALGDAEDLYENAPVGYHSLDDAGRIVRINATELEWLGRRREDVVGRPYVDFLSADSRAPFGEQFEASTRQDKVRDLRYELLRADGSTIPVQLSATAVRDAEGRLVQSRAVVENVTARQQSERWAAELFDSFTSPVAVYDPVRDAAGEIVDFRRVYANPPTAELLRRPLAEVIGSTLRSTGLPQFFQSNLAIFGRVLRTGTPENMPDLELTQPSTGRPLTLAVSLSRVGDRVAQVSRDVTVERTAEREITAARVEAERANRAKSEFLSRMSHELRTPLNAILGFSQLLEMDSLSSDQRESVSYIGGAGRHLLDLINEVLDISRIESGQMTISAEPVAIRDLMGELVALIGPLADARSITVDTTNTGCELHVRADRQRLKQVLLNLLANAVKYNRERGSVTVACAIVEVERLRISVADTGYGLRPEQLDRLFNPFDRLGAEGSGVEGTGMGLALSKGLVEAMGGRIGVESELDQGTTFWVELGLVDDPLATYENARADDDASDAPTTLPTHKVLHIEDNVSNLKLIERIVARRTDIELISAMQAQLGIDLARQQRPDLVILDLHLPDMSGHEVLLRLRSYPETRDIPVVILSADATKTQITRLTEDGATGYLTKPIDVRAFFELVDSILGGLPSDVA
jgi:PAS domain S-box-containing protein